MEYPSGLTPHLDYFLENVELVERYGSFTGTGIILDDYQAIKIELQFLKTFQKCIVRNQHLEDDSESAIAAILSESYDLMAQSNDLLTKIMNMPCVVSTALCRIGETRHIIRYFYEQISLSLESYIPMTEDLVVELIDDLMQNIKYLLNSEVNLAVPLKREIEIIRKELKFLRNFLILAAKRCSDYERFKDLLAHTEARTIDAARLSYSCFYVQRNEETSLEIKLQLSDLLQKLKPTNSAVREMYTRVLNALNLFESSNTIKHKHLFGAFIDSLQDNLFEILNLEPRYKHSLQEQLISLSDEFKFLRSILMNPPEEYIDSENLNNILRYADSVIIESACLIFSLHSPELRVEIAIEKNILLANLLAKIQYIKEEARKVYLKIPKLMPSEFSNTVGLCFIESFLENLKVMLCHFDNSIAFPKCRIETVQKEFEFFYSFLSNMEKQLDQQDKLKYLWTQVIEVAYHAEYVIDSFVIKDSPIWYYMLWLGDIMEEIQIVKADATNLLEEMQCDTKAHTTKKPSVSALISRANSPTLDERVVGFEDEEEKVMQLLLRGSGAKLDVVSIVGMPGSGKTTLSKKIYNSQSVAKYFHVRAWCCVSQVYQKRDLFLSILSHIVPLNAEMELMDEDGLALVLYKSLKGWRYLIILDDIWDVQVWHDFRMLFPDDKNGSRIMFTSRLVEVALQAKLHSNPHALRPLKDEECWELLQHLVFLKERCPLELRDIGAQIANGCKGVPLSVVLVAGLLGTKKTKDSWTEVAQSLASRLISNPQSHCMDIIGMSYNCLPDHLKPCFLYFGAFLEDEEIHVNRLIWLWTAEGFVRKFKGKSIDDTAEGLLKDLISRNLVTVSRWKATGGIKACRLHDLLYYFCKAKSKEENFWQSIYVDAFTDPSVQTYEACRLCINFGTGQHSHLHGSKKALMEKSENSVSHSHVRSALILGRIIIYLMQSASEAFKLLRVLDLMKVEFSEFPPGLEMLIHLKYLAVRAHAGLIPESITNLLNLEILVLYSPFRTFLPTIWKSKRLRHLYALGFVMFLSDVRKQVSSPRPILPKLLVHDQQKQNILNEADKLYSLEAISNLSIFPGEDKEIFRKIPNIRRLGCILEGSLVNEYNYIKESSMPGCMTYSFSPKLELLDKLESLNLDCNVHLSHHTMRKRMKKKHLWKFSFPSTLKKLTLCRCHLQWTEISTIGRLGNLEVLKLASINFEGQRWNMIDGEFPKLRHLQLENVDLKEWDAATDHLPYLERLVLKSCCQLKEVPSCLGSIATLRIIKVEQCIELDVESVRQIQQEQVDMGNNEFKVIIDHPNWDEDE
ncbi:hypothetical protein M9H77_09681 [Catharanthus roseus]|uniref:Uncharacterized protein n=1 Tax=Catharanthus roseus TaxID=4058 RepID=A0ACC0C1R4_CATRO|nr:hypothetical protein M9H77_09681 [Catharanthus roseus]